MVSSIQYPHAYDATGAVVQIRDANKRGAYNCIGCTQPMICRQGKIREWHFAHRAESSSERCDPDNALHEMGKALTIQGFNMAVEQNTEYTLGVLCNGCRRTTASKNVASHPARIESEKSLVEGTRSDLVITTNENRSLILEIVVTHSLEPETQDAYRNSGIPILMKTISTWSDLEGLKFAFIADNSLNVRNQECAECKRSEIEAKSRARQAAIEEIARIEKQAQVVARALKRMEDRVPLDPDHVPFRLWGTGKRFQKHKVNATILHELGFRQTSKQWLFAYLTPWGVVYADLGRDRRYRAASVFVVLERSFDSGGLQEAIVNGVLDRCRLAGADVHSTA